MCHSKNRLKQDLELSERLLIILLILLLRYVLCYSISEHAVFLCKTVNMLSQMYLYSALCNTDNFKAS